VRSAVITLLAGRHRHLRLQRRGLLAGTLQPGLQVVVAMNDPAVTGVLDERSPEPDIVQLSYKGGQLPLARARNLGARHAISRGADFLIFLDVDCVPGARRVQRYTEHAGSQDSPACCAAPSPTCHRHRSRGTRSLPWPASAGRTQPAPFPPKRCAGRW
jgi:hypothetical protein